MSTFNGVFQRLLRVLRYSVLGLAGLIVFGYFFSIKLGAIVIFSAVAAFIISKVSVVVFFLILVIGVMYIIKDQRMKSRVDEN